MANDKKGWWYRASKEQRLEQIKAGIELGMTSKQVAMNCGCYYAEIYSISGGDPGGSLVASYALRYGLHFPRGNTFAANSRLRTSRIARLSRQRAHDQSAISEAFDIFGIRSTGNEFTDIFEAMGA